MSVLEELLTLERGFWEAPGHPDYYERRMADGAVVVFGFEDGIMDKAALMPTVESAPPWLTYDIGNPRVIELTPDSAALVYNATARREAAAEYRANITSVYVRRGGEWQLAVHQQSPIG